MTTPSARDRRVFGDSLERGIDGYAGRNLEGPKSIFDTAQKGKDGERRWQSVPDASTLRQQASQPTLADGEFSSETNLITYSLLAAAAQVESLVPLGGDGFYEALCDAVAAVVQGAPEYSQVPRLAEIAPGFEARHLNRVIADMGLMVGQIRKDSVPMAPPEQATLFDGVFAVAEASDVRQMATASSKVVAQLMTVKDLDQVVWVWLARERAQQLQAGRDPDLATLLYLRNAIEANYPFEEIRGSEYFRRSDILLGRAVEMLHSELHAGIAAADHVIPALIAQGDSVRAIEMSALLGYIDPVAANRFNGVGAVDPARYAKRLNPARTIAAMDRGMLQRIVMRRGLRDNGPEEKTFDERALRSLRGIPGAAEALRLAAGCAGVSETKARKDPSLLIGHGKKADAALRAAGRRIGLTITTITPGALTEMIARLETRELELVAMVDPWVRRGDPSLLIEEMVRQEAQKARTQWIFKTEWDLGVKNQFAAEAAAFGILGGEPYERLGYEEALFRAKPELIVKDVTRVPFSI